VHILAGDTLAARHGLYDLDLFPVDDDEMAEVDEPLVAGMGTQPLERSVVGLYGVVIVVMGVYPIRVHSP
jgi:hypothetical protein